MPSKRKPTSSDAAINPEKIEKPKLFTERIDDAIAEIRKILIESDAAGVADALEHAQSELAELTEYCDEMIDNYEDTEDDEV